MDRGETEPQKDHLPAHHRRESDRARQAYLLYKRMGLGRSFPGLARQLHRRYPGHYRGTETTLVRRLKQWAHDYNWRERVRAYDDEQEAAQRRALDQARDIMYREQAVLARVAVRRVFKRIYELLDLDEVAIYACRQLRDLLLTGQPVPNELMAIVETRPLLTISPQALITLLRDCIAIERTAREEIIAIAAQQHPRDITIEIITTTIDGERSISTSGSAALPFLTYDPNDLLRQDHEGASSDDAIADLGDDPNDVAQKVHES